MVVETTAISGKILAIDEAKHKGHFEDPEGKKKTVKVRKSVDLSGLAVGGVLSRPHRVCNYRRHQDVNWARLCNWVYPPSDYLPA